MAVLLLSSYLAMREFLGQVLRLGTVPLSDRVERTPAMLSAALQDHPLPVCVCVCVCVCERDGWTGTERQLHG